MVSAFAYLLAVFAAGVVVALIDAHGLRVVRAVWRWLR